MSTTAMITPKTTAKPRSTRNIPASERNGLGIASVRPGGQITYTVVKTTIHMMSTKCQ
jgi:hypothetical protein